MILIERAYPRHSLSDTNWIVIKTNRWNKPMKYLHKDGCFKEWGKHSFRALFTTKQEAEEALKGYLKTLTPKKFAAYIANKINEE